VPSFQVDGQRLVYTEFGSGDRVFVLIHGQLLSQRMHEPLAQELARRGNRVVTLDLLGHGWSDRPKDMWRYSMTQFAEQVVALLDHLGLRQAVVGGTSLGANVTLEFAAIAPERANGLVIEMPVLDHGTYGAVLAFTPLLTALKYARPVVNLMSSLFRLVPRDPLPLLGKIVVDAVGQDHSASEYILQGLFMGRIAPGPAVRRGLEHPALVLGHPGDPIHPLGDAEMLAQEMPNAMLVEAESIYELRFRPERLTDAISEFLDQCWDVAPTPRAAGPDRPRRAPSHRPARRRAVGRHARTASARRRA